jgi:hypothetical protein
VRRQRDETIAPQTPNVFVEFGVRNTVSDRAPQVSNT